jgi:hypothetical protein
MPCYDPRSDVSWDDVERCDSNWSRDYSELEKKYNKLVDMTCDTFRTMEARGTIDILSPEARIWWENHKKEDEERLVREAKDRESAKQAIRAAIGHLEKYVSMTMDSELPSDDKRYFESKIEGIKKEVDAFEERFPGIVKEVMSA